MNVDEIERARLQERKGLVNRAGGSRALDGEVALHTKLSRQEGRGEREPRTRTKGVHLLIEEPFAKLIHSKEARRDLVDFGEIERPFRQHSGRV